MTKEPRAETQLEIIPKSTAEKLDAHERNIKTYIRGHHKGAAEQFGYAFLAGHELLTAKATIAHGNKNPNAGLQKWVQARFKQITYRTASNWMQFADLVRSKMETVSTFKSSPLMLTRGKINAQDRQTILQIVPQVMDGKGMMKFMRDSRLLRDPEAPKHNARKKVDPDKALAAKQKQAKRLWTSIFSDLGLASEVAKHLPDDSRASAAFELTKYLPCLVKGLPRKHTEQVLGTLVDITSALRETLKKP